ncbi:hypothetical protein HK097_007170 [Rhizophlyctis rosea]|uniref:Phytase-like domain-containing protein n=1 Tax=Rhizophlyctis rosea TaxID=64517 RepID=A0AAD5SDV6_9FUNG|nr:hypothetical protein HK097_007170 [Rhizophlyctis rosea]
MTRLISFTAVTLFALRVSAASSIESLLTNTPAEKSTILVDPYKFPDTDVRKYNPFLSESEVSAYPGGNACNSIDDGQICRDRPAYGSGVHYLNTPVNGNTFPFPVWISHTDRGPNQDCEELGENPNYNQGTEWEGRVGKGFPIPRFAPSVFSWTLDSNGVKLIKNFSLKKSNGDQILGRSNTGNDDVNYGEACRGNTLPLTPDGIDFEDIHPHPDGIHFWGSDEYSPSVFIFDASGKVKLRLVPNHPVLANLTTASAGYPIKKILPSVLVSRRQNRGFENLAVSYDGKTLWAVLQSPMGNKSLDEIKPSIVIRAVKVDISDINNPKYVGLYAFEGSKPEEYTVGKKIKPADLKFSAGQYLGGGQILLLERADNAGLKLYVVDFSRATNLKGSIHESDVTLEKTRTGEADFGIKYATKKKVFDSDDIEGGDKYFTKMEGVAILSPTVVATVTDNDFGLNQGGRSQVDLLHLTSKLPHVKDVVLPKSYQKHSTCAFKTCAGKSCFHVLPGLADNALAKDACELYGGKLAATSLINLKAVLSGAAKGKIVWVGGSKVGYGVVLKSGKLWWSSAANKYSALCEVPKPANC